MEKYFPDSEQIKARDVKRKRKGFFKKAYLVARQEIRNLADNFSEKFSPSYQSHNALLRKTQTSHERLEEQYRQTQQELAEVSSQYNVVAENNEQLRGELETAVVGNKVLKAELLKTKISLEEARDTLSKISDSRILFEEGAFEPQIAKGETYGRNWAHDLEELTRKKVDSSQQEAKYQTARARVIEDVAIGVAVNAVISSKSLRKIPFVYYGFDSKELYYTPAAQKLFGLNPNERHLKKEDDDGANVRKQIFQSLREGSPLSHVHAICSKTNKELRITTRPYFLDESKEKAIGTVILLDDPLLSLKRARNRRVLKGIEELINKTSQAIYNRVRDELEKQGIPEPVKT